MWNTKVLKLVECQQSQSWLMVTLSMITIGMNLSIINVYIPNNYWEKIECWGSLLDLAKGNPLHNLIIVGDFNITISLKEKRGGSIVRDQFREKMDDLISNLDVYMMFPRTRDHLLGTIKGKGLDHIATRLDHFLISNSFSHCWKKFLFNPPLGGLESSPNILGLCS
jgi:exonuclease III